MAVGTVGMADRDKKDAPFTRASTGFEQFINSLQVEHPLSVLDLGGASQANLSFLAGLGHLNRTT